MKRFYILALVAMMFAACTTDETQDVQLADAPETLTVGFEGGDDDTRVQLNEAGKTVWTKDDLVSVFYKSDANDCWKFTGNTGDRTATLQRVSKGEGTRRGDNVVVVYPYRDDYLISLSSNSVEAYLPATQTFCEGSYGVGSSPMVGFGDYKQFVLKNVCGWLKLQITGNGERVQSISLKGNNGEQVAGDILIVAEDASTILAAASVDVDDSEVGGSLLLEDDILTEVTLDCGNGVELGAEPTAFYIALPPQTFEKGLTVEIETAEGGIMTKSTENSIAIERNTIQPMATFKFINPNTPTQPTPANNEIWYTETAKVEPYDPDEFGTTITSNVWDSESGKGVITFNANVTKIGYYAFYECKKLKTITIPDSVTSIGGGAFSSCSSLTSITIPDSVTSIGYNAFYNCTSLTTITIPDSVTSIGSGVFSRCTSLTSVTIPDSVTSIGYSAFSGCTSLKAFYGKFASEDNRCLIVNGVLNSFAIGCGATSYTIPDSVTSIGGYAFRNCTSLTSVTIPDSVIEIGNHAFEDCTSLISITIPDSVTSIGKYAFRDCTSLKEVYCKPTTPPTGGYRMFSYYDYGYIPIGCKIYVPASADDSIINAYKAKEYWSDYADYIFEMDEEVESAPANNEIWYTNGSTTEATAPNETDVFGANIVSNLYDAEKECWVITFDGDVTKIGSSAFSNCTSLTSVTIPDSVTKIGNYAFYYCTSLKEVYCKPTTPPNGGSSMFYNNASGRKIYVPASEDDSIINAYKAKQYWSDYASYIEEYDFSAGQ